MDTFTMTFSIPPDDEGYLGRECPGCESYFKITPGTGLEEVSGCHCPYCGHFGPNSTFHTPDQIESAQSIALNRITTDLLGSLKRLERRSNPRALIDFSISVSGRPYPIRFYQERWLEQEVVCDRCALRYAIFGVFGYCPDCGAHNSYQMLEANLDIARKMLALAAREEDDLRRQLIENALEDAVSSFDAFGRQVWSVHLGRQGADPAAEPMSFQNISAARQRVLDRAGVDFAQDLSEEGWSAVVRAFQQRHLLAHRMGVIDAAYLTATGESRTLLGRRVEVSPEQVGGLGDALRSIGKRLFTDLVSS